VVKELRTIDVGDIPALLRIAEEVATTREPRLLRRGGETLAMLSPLRPTRKRPTRAPKATDRAAFRAAAGSWHDVDTDKLVADIYAGRRRSSRPPIQL
jgi:hypothetical protein